MMNDMRAPSTMNGLASASVAAPNFWACMTAASASYKFCNTSLPLDERVSALVGELTLEEKINTLSGDATHGNVCDTHTDGVPSLGVPQWMWLVETNTGVNSACYKQDICATTFPGPMGMAASFNRSLWRMKGGVLGTELRAFNNLQWYRNAGGTPLGTEKIGLTGFGPNINIARDPRFGRSSELPGEDPVLSGVYASEMVQGMQARDAAGYPKMLAYLKHFTAYSTEANRFHDDHNISTFDLFDTYLPAYEYAFTHAEASGAMCSYNAVNGRPSCANGYVLNTLLRKWAPHAIVTSDCGAVSNLKGSPVNARTNAAAAAYAINNGTDLEMGSTMYRGKQGLMASVASGLTSEAAVTTAVRRTQRQLFSLGRYDPPRASAWTSLGAEAINSSAHRAIQHEAGLQSLVLLRNDGHALPLAAGLHVAVLGPQAVARKGLLSDYYGDEVCRTSDTCQGRECFACIPTVAEAIGRLNDDEDPKGGGVTTSASAVDVNSTNASGIPHALKLAAAADVVVLVLGIDRTIERETHDRNDTALPGLQQPFASAVLRLCKPTVLVLVNGGALAIDKLLQREPGTCAGSGKQGSSASSAPPPPYAIVEAFNPNVVGGRPLAEALFGKANRWGKLPVTMYPHAFLAQKPMADYDMSSGVGRTYRYFTEAPLFPFGFGLSYTTFATTCTLGGRGPAPRSLRLACSVRNTGAVDGDEVVMLYHAAGPALRASLPHPAPRRALVDFARVRVCAGCEVPLPFTVTESMLRLVNAEGERVLYKGGHLLEVTGEGAGAPRRQVLHVRVGGAGAGDDGGVLHGIVPDVVG